MKWRQASDILYNRRIPQKLKDKFYRTVMRPTILGVFGMAPEQNSKEELTRACQTP